MIIKIAEHSGFCFGVKQAIETAENVISEHTGDPDSPGVYSFGPLIHNQSVNDDLTAKGLVITDDLNNIPEGSTVIVRSHGEPESFYSEAKSRGLVITDATCPFVARIHKLVSEAAKAGKNIVIVGDRTHPEVEGITFEGKYIKYTGDIGLNGKGNLYLGAEANKEKLATYGELDDEYTSIREYRNL
jgi:4-hydroxy-3-methylbut-2-enyl diphosphate reductase